jgi:hypothetical protein
MLYFINLRFLAFRQMVPITISYQWSQGNLTAVLGTSISPDADTTGNVVGTGVSPNDGYGQTVG